MALSAAIRAHENGRTSDKLVAAFHTALEDATTNLDHEFLARPVATILAAWVGESDILARLHTISPDPTLDFVAQTTTPTDHNTSTGASPTAVKDKPPLSLRPLPTRVLLVARSGSRQDDAAMDYARAAVATKFGADAAIVLRLAYETDPDEEYTLASVLTRLTTFVRTALDERLREAVAEAEKARRARPSTIRAWLGMSSNPRQPAFAATPLISHSSPASSSRSLFGETDEDVPSDASNQTTTATSSSEPDPTNLLRASSDTPGLTPDTATKKQSRHTRRASTGPGTVHTPLFAPTASESLARHAADLTLLSGQYSAAADAFQSLANEIASNSLTGPALVHEASAVEACAIALALADGSKPDVGKGLERAIKMYARAGRRELAVRATLRAATYCFEAGFPDSAAGVLDRALVTIFPSYASARAQTVGSFSETAVAMLLARSAFMFLAMGRMRKGSLYAFLSAMRLSNQTFHGAAALVARDIGPKALTWPGVNDEVELILARAEKAANRPSNALAHYVGVMANTSESTDVEVQNRAIMGFHDIVATDADGLRPRRWDAGMTFPRLYQGERPTLRTPDSQRGAADESGGNRDDDDGGGGGGGTGGEDNDDDDAWRSLEDDVLMDVDYFSDVRDARAAGKPLPKRPRSIDSVVADLRRERAADRSKDPGGSFETKIERMREAAATTAQQRRSRSLLGNGAVAEEAIHVEFSMHNPLLFPVFVESLTAVVTMDGQLCDACTQDDTKTSPTSVGQGVSEDVPVDLVRADSIVLVPCAKQRVSVQVIPRRSGTLRFIGARWTFSVARGASPNSSPCAAHGYCSFATRGRRLNDTRRQRASEIPLYEEDTSMQVCVVPRSGRLDVRVCDEDSEADDNVSNAKPAQLQLLAGEKKSICIEVTNKGLERVDRAVVRTNTPQSLFLDMGPEDGFELPPVADSAHAEQAIVSGCLTLDLDPGQSVRKRAWVLGALTGESEVRVAFAYGTTKTRIARLSFVTKIGPSLNAFPRFIRRAPRTPRATPAGVPSFGGSDDDTYLLGIEVEHAGKTAGSDSFEVASVAVSSRDRWCASGLPRVRLPAGYEDQRRSLERHTLRINETATEFVILTRAEELEPEEYATARLQTCSLKMGSAAEVGSDDGFTHSSSGDLDASNADDAALREAKALEHFVVSSGLSRRVAPGLDALYVVVRWRSSRGRAGELYLPPLDPGEWSDDESDDDGESDGDDGSRFRSEAALDARPATARACDVRRPVSVRIEHAKRVRHPFTTATKEATGCAPAVVPVDIYVRNETNSLLDASLTAPVTGGIADGDRGRFWAGHVDVTLRALPPRIERRVCMTAALEAPGSYDLGKLSMTVRTRCAAAFATQASGRASPAASRAHPRSRDTTTVPCIASSIVVVEDSRDGVKLAALARPAGPPRPLRRKSAAAATVPPLSAGNGAVPALVTNARHSPGAVDRRKARSRTPRAAHRRVSDPTIDSVWDESSDSDGGDPHVAAH